MGDLRTRSPSNPCCTAAQPSLEVIRTDGKKLIAYVQRPAAIDTSKIFLTTQHPPGFISNVYEDIAAA
jgi:hypothetical protein